jgi:hypothetical protein
MRFKKTALCIIALMTLASADYKSLSPDNEIFRSQKYVVIPFDTLNSKLGVQVYDINTGALLTRIAPLIGGNKTTGISVSDQSGRIVITTIDYSVNEDMGRTAQCYDISGKLLWKYPLVGENILIISPSGAYATSLVGDNLIVLDGKTGQPLHASTQPANGENAGPDSVLMSAGTYVCAFDKNDDLILIQNSEKSIFKFNIAKKEIVAREKIDIDTALLIGAIGRPATASFSTSPSHEVISAAFFVYKKGGNQKSIGSVVYSWDCYLKQQMKTMYDEPVQKLRMLSENKILTGNASRTYKLGRCLKIHDLNDKSTRVLEDSPYYSEFTNAVLTGDSLFYQMRANKHDPYHKTIFSGKMHIANAKSLQDVDAIPVFEDMKNRIKVAK